MSSRNRLSRNATQHKEEISFPHSLISSDMSCCGLSSSLSINTGSNITYFSVQSESFCIFTFLLLGHLTFKTEKNPVTQNTTQVKTGSSPLVDSVNKTCASSDLRCRRSNSRVSYTYTPSSTLEVGSSDRFIVLSSVLYTEHGLVNPVQPLQSTVWICHTIAQRG